MRPMLATQGDQSAGPPAGPRWAHEIKWDGIRLLADVRRSQLQLLTRSGRDIAVAFPELAALARVADDLLLDGEAVTMIQGRPSFSHVVDRVHTGSAGTAAALAAARPATYLAFDLLRLDGLDLTRLPWSDRRRALEDLLPQLASVRLSPVYEDGTDLLAATADQGLEGVVSKRRDAPYQPGARSGAWQKFPHRQVHSVIVGGWRPQSGTTARLGAVHVGLPVPGPDGRCVRDEAGRLLLSYLGRVGSGLAGRAGEQLKQVLGTLGSAAGPFLRPVPSIDAAGSTWVEPKLVIDVAALGITGEGRLRQPSYQGLRIDLSAEDLLEEMAR